MRIEIAEANGQNFVGAGWEIAGVPWEKEFEGEKFGGRRMVNGKRGLSVWVILPSNNPSRQVSVGIVH